MVLEVTLPEKMAGKKCSAKNASLVLSVSMPVKVNVLNQFSFTGLLAVCQGQSHDHWLHQTLFLNFQLNGIFAGCEFIQLLNAFGNVTNSKE